MNDDAFLGLSREQLDQIDQTCDLFEAGQRAETPVSIEEFLVEADEKLRKPLLRELLDVELCRRRTAGMATPVEEYRARFPQWTDAVDEAFEAASGPSTDSATQIASRDDTDRSSRGPPANRE